MMPLPEWLLKSQTILLLEMTSIMVSF